MTAAERVLVTGAGGFIGSHLVEGLLATGAHVRAFVRYTSTSGVGFLEDLPADVRDRFEIVLGDIRDPRSVREACRDCRRVYHLAALIGIPYSYVAPDAYVDVNIRGTLNVLEATRDLGLERVIVTSTSEVYGTAQYAPIDERHPLNAQSPYAATKVGADQLALSYHRAFGTPVTVVRPFNTYGPRQSARAIVPTILSQVLGANEIRVGSLTPVRDLVFVGDTVAGFIKVANAAECIGHVTNLATGSAVSIGELIERIQKIAGTSLPVRVADERKRPEASEVFKLLGNAEQARSLAKWTPTVSLDDGLRHTLEWMRGQMHRYRPGEYRV